MSVPYDLVMCSCGLAKYASELETGRWVFTCTDCDGVGFDVDRIRTADAAEPDEQSDESAPPLS